MTTLQAIVYGFVQGATEFLPISSNAHLRLVPELFGWADPGAAFTAMIQLGTVLAALLYFRHDLAGAAAGFFRSLGGDRRSPEARLGWSVFFGTLPIILLGVLLKKPIETTFRSLWVIAFSFIALGLVMLLAERRGRRTRGLDGVRTRDGAIVGVWQALSLVPGMSRSGTTIAGGLFRDLDHAAAARFSFLLGIPAITAAGIYEALKERRAIVESGLVVPTLVAAAVAFVVGYASIAWLIGILKRRGVLPFVGYRLALGALLIVLLATGRLAPLRVEADEERGVVPAASR